MKKLFYILSLTVFFVSCSESKNRLPVMKEAFLSETAYDDSYEYSDMSNLAGRGFASNTSTGSTDFVYERKLIKTGTISIQVSDISEAMQSVEKWTETYGGYISYSNNYNDYCNYTVKIPAEAFDKSMNSLASIGKIKNRSVSVEDVTEQFYDLTSRLETKKTLREKYTQYLKKAENVKDLLEVERQLNDVIAEIEAMEGRLRLLSNKINYSTIEIHLQTPDAQVVPSYSINGIRWKEIFYNIINFMLSLFKVVIYIIVYGIPIFALLALAYWLLLGKIGLFKKLINRLHGNNPKELKITKETKAAKTTTAKKVSGKGSKK